MRAQRLYDLDSGPLQIGEMLPDDVVKLAAYPLMKFGFDNDTALAELTATP